MMDIHQATRSYESWLKRQTPVVPPDLYYKHGLIRSDPFTFLRGTFYRWIQVWPAVCPSLAASPRVLAVGDLHIENFGTWRDSEGRLVWGVNDLDEASLLPYSSDLVRLATSAVLAVRQKHLALSVRKICESILDGYATALKRGGRPIVLAERHGWLREIAVQELSDPVKFWKKLRDNPAAADMPTGVMQMLALPPSSEGLRIMRRRAGTGSLGRRRFVAVAMHHGGLIAREAKAVVPPASAWVSGARTASQSMALNRQAVRAADPFFNANAQWSVRRLSPDCTKIETGDFPRKRDDAKLLRAMGWETANLHLGTSPNLINKDLAAGGHDWLERAANDMAENTLSEWRAWKSGAAD